MPKETYTIDSARCNDKLQNDHYMPGLYYSVGLVFPDQTCSPGLSQQLYLLHTAGVTKLRHYFNQTHLGLQH